MSEYFNKLRKYNYWEGETIRIGFRRDGYLEKMVSYTGNSLIKVLTGQRRTGKSYLLRQMIEKLIASGINPINICYFNKEIIEFDGVDDFQALHDLITEYRTHFQPLGRVYLFLDEIQLIDGWEKLVNSYSQDYVEAFEIFLTGSNSVMFSGELATLLSGRYVTIEVFPFSFTEYCQFKNEEKTKLSLIKYLKTGGLPELHHLDDEEIKFHYTSSLRDTILLKDIVQRYNIKDAWLLENLFRFISLNIGNLFSVNAIVNYFNSHRIRTNHETILNYLNYLKQSYLIHEVERYNIKAKETLAGARKFYLNDLAFRNYSSLRFEFGLAQNLENFIYLHCRKNGFKVTVGNLKDKEIDFVLDKGAEKRYLQVTWMLTDESVIEREFGNLEAIADQYPKSVISMDDLSFGNRNGIIHQVAWDFKF